MINPYIQWVHLVIRNKYLKQPRLIRLHLLIIRVRIKSYQKERYETLENKPAFASQDTNLIKRCVQYYIKNGPFLSESEKNQYTQLYHRMGRVSGQSNVLREPAETPDAPYLKETLFDDIGG